MAFWFESKSRGSAVEVDNEGYLIDPSQWCEILAQEIADLEDITLQEPHWAVVRFVRDQYELNQAVPDARHVLRMLKQIFGEKRATRKALYALFPYGYGQQACKIAGMRKSLKLMLDV
ncbi:MAG: TusE/DsrC/DsvC family sulfur relay protein [Granulosicoccaceae bacterium]